MVQTMRRDTHLLEKIKGGFCNQVINGYDTAYISIRFDSFKKSKVKWRFSDVGAIGPN